MAQGNIALNLAFRGEEATDNYPNATIFNSMDMAQELNWQTALRDCDTVIHTAARVHIMNEKAEDPLFEFRKTNVEGTLHLAKQAAKLGIKRFIFISSIKVNGESTLTNQAFLADDCPNPQDPYAVSKLEAEQGLQLIAKETGMELVIIRPPLIYGPGVKGNFQRIIRLILCGFPLPLGAIKNKRSFVSLNNLADLIKVCLKHPKAANQIFLVSDGHDLSTTELLYNIAQAINKSLWLLPIPESVLKFVGYLLGKKEVFERLCGSLQVDISKTCELLDWQPKTDSENDLKRMV